MRTLAAVALIMPWACRRPPSRRACSSASRRRSPTAPTGTRFGLVVRRRHGQGDRRGRARPALHPRLEHQDVHHRRGLRCRCRASTGPTPTAARRCGWRHGRAPPNVVLTGNGDARLSSAADCAIDCLATLADAVAARTRRVGDVIGDDSLYPDQRWSPGMSWNNIPTRSGTAISALTHRRQRDRAARSRRARSARPPVDRGLRLLHDRQPRGDGRERQDRDRLRPRCPTSATLRLTGTIAVGAPPEKLRLGIDDPAHYAAWRLKAMLRGARRAGHRRRSRPATGRFAAADDPAQRGGAPVARPPRPEPLARLTPPPLVEDLTLHQQGQPEPPRRAASCAASAWSRAAARSRTGRSRSARCWRRRACRAPATTFPTARACRPTTGVAPRAAVTFLRWVATQPWGAAWRATLPIGGRRRHARATASRARSLEGKLFAKTGTLNATNALSGYLTAQSGRTLTFAVFANDMPAERQRTEGRWMPRCVHDRRRRTDRSPRGVSLRVERRDHRIAGRGAQRRRCRCRDGGVGWTRLVSSVQASPRSKSTHRPVPVKPVWPIVSAEQAWPPDQPANLRSQPQVRCS